MKSFSNIECFVDDVYNIVTEDNSVAIVAFPSFVKEFVKYLYETGAVFDYVNYDVDYEDEYAIIIDENGSVSMEQIKDFQEYSAISADFAYLHEDIKARFLDYQSSGFVYDVFEIVDDNDYFDEDYDDYDETEDDESDCDCDYCNDTNESESVYISRAKDGTPAGFSKSWVTTQNDVTCYSSYSHYSNNVDDLKQVATKFGINL